MAAAIVALLSAAARRARCRSATIPLLQLRQRHRRGACGQRTATMPRRRPRDKPGPGGVSAAASELEGRYASGPGAQHDLGWRRAQMRRRRAPGRAALPDHFHPGAVRPFFRGRIPSMRIQQFIRALVMLAALTTLARPRPGFD
ncbi:MAG: hypothetical protein IPN21_17805 [Burkholderiales bacterium]|nr:hypothetical protein [Burkholderiales bacterium]